MVAPTLYTACLPSPLRSSLVTRNGHLAGGPPPRYGGPPTRQSLVDLDADVCDVVAESVRIVYIVVEHAQIAPYVFVRLVGILGVPHAQSHSDVYGYQLDSNWRSEAVIIDLVDSERAE